MFAKYENNTVRILDEQKIIGPKGEQSSRQILDLWTAEELKDWGIYEVSEVDPIPVGQRLVSEKLVRTGDNVRLVRVTEAAPIEAPTHFIDVVAPWFLEAMLWQQNQIRVLQGLEPLKDVDALKAEVKK